MNTHDPPDIGRGNKRVFRWAAILATLLILGAVVFGVLWYRKAPPEVEALPASGPTIQNPRPAPEKAPGS